RRLFLSRSAARDTLTASSFLSTKRSPVMAEKKPKKKQPAEKAKKQPKPAKDELTDEQLDKVAGGARVEGNLLAQQRLMSDYNQAQTLASNIQTDTKDVIRKLGR